MKNVRKGRDIKPEQTTQNGTIWYQNQTIIQQVFFSENVLVIEMEKKPEMLTNKTVFLSLSILETNKSSNV